MVIAAVVAVVVLVGAGGYELTRSHSTPPVAPVQPVAVAQPVAPATVATVLAQVMANALAQKSVHMDVKDASPKHGVAAYSDDDAITGGMQRVTVNGAHTTVRVIGSTTFFTADRAGFMKLYKLSAAQAGQVRGQWIPLVPGEPDYTSVTDGVTLASSLTEIGLTGPLTRLPVSRKDGQRVYGIRGRPTGHGVPKKARATLWISVGPHGLPVEFDAASGRTTMTVHFRRWGRPVTLVAPSPIFGQPGLSG